MPTRIEIHLTFDGAFNVGAGALGGSLADKPLTRDARGLPMVPASSFKGRLRHEVERLAAHFYPDGPAPCLAPVAETMCQGDGPPCPVCALFGSPWQSGRLRFSDFTLIEPAFLLTGPPQPGHVRPGVALSRHRKVAEDQLLYTTEVFLPGSPLTLAGEISGELEPQQLKLLQAGLNMLLALGGGKTRGLGWVKLDYTVQTEPALAPPAGGATQLTELEVMVRLASPLLLGTEATEAYYKITQEYIPGRVLRGALAETLLAACDHPAGQPHHDCDFGRLFEGEQSPIFEDLQPVTADNYPFPLPQTARSCKYHAGFEATKRPSERGHGVGDILIPQAIFDHLLAGPAVRLPLLYRPRCPECGAEVEPFSGSAIITRGPEGRFEYDDVPVPIRRTSRTAIDRRRAVAVDGQLYTLEAIEPAGPQGQPVRFRGAIRGSAEQLALVQAWLPRVSALGNGRSRGLGRVMVEQHPPGRLDQPLPSLAARFSAFNEAWKKEWCFYQKVAGVAPLPAGEYYFSLTLLSPASLTFQGQPLTLAGPEQLGFTPAEVELVRAFASHHLSSGWHLGAGLPRRTQLAIGRGSVFLYRSRGLAEEALLARLAALENRGLGSETLRRQGLGRIIICLPFHYQAEVSL